YRSHEVGRSLSVDSSGADVANAINRLTDHVAQVAHGYFKNSYSIFAVCMTSTTRAGRRRGQRKRPVAATHVSDAAENESSVQHKRLNGSGVVNVRKAVVLSAIDYSLILSLVFGGCCANVWSYEHLLKMNAHIGTTLTFSQMLFITLQSLPSFLSFPKKSLLPRLKPRHVPLREWAAQVIVLTSGSLLNNWAFAFNVPLTVQIVFRSAGLAVSMLFGYVFLKKRYSLSQIAAVGLVSVGVVAATLSRPSASSAQSASQADPRRYSLGVLMLTASLFLTGVLGTLQEHTYSTYGPHWKEGVFYTHCLSLPIFLFFIPDVKRGIQSLSAPSSTPHASGIPSVLSFIVPYLVLAANLVTQLACVSGVNQLTSHVSSVSTNLVLTTRKALSLCFSVWWFGNGWNAQLGVGAGMVFLGSLLYTFVSSRSAATAQTPQARQGTRSKRK
ncbi:UDP-N-acetylglucosamine transporter YEA4, partial [Grifola frondosa]